MNESCASQANLNKARLNLSRRCVTVSLGWAMWVASGNGWAEQPPSTVSPAPTAPLAGPSSSTQPRTPVLGHTPPSDLTEGLLELLNEPALQRQPASPASQPPPGSPRDLMSPLQEQSQKGLSQKGLSQGASNQGASNQGHDLGGDLGPAPVHALQPIHQAMALLATRLRQPTSTQTSSQPQFSSESQPASDWQDTEQLQQELLHRLDDLIAQLQEQPADRSSAPTGSSTNSTAGSANDRQSQASGQQSQASGQQTGRPTAQANPSGPGTGDQPAGDQPGGEPSSNPSDAGTQAGQDANSLGNQSGNQSGNDSSQTRDAQPGALPPGNRNPIVDLNDPSALQRSAWGNLPQRLREQMQSRMVERFLPGYREDIEAYYRALAK